MNYFYARAVIPQRDDNMGYPESINLFYHKKLSVREQVLYIDHFSSARADGGVEPGWTRAH